MSLQIGAPTDEQIRCWGRHIGISDLPDGLMKSVGAELPGIISFVFTNEVTFPWVTTLRTCIMPSQQLQNGPVSKGRRCAGRRQGAGAGGGQEETLPCSYSDRAQLPCGVACCQREELQSCRPGALEHCCCLEQPASAQSTQGKLVWAAALSRRRASLGKSEALWISLM